MFPADWAIVNIIQTIGINAQKTVTNVHTMWGKHCNEKWIVIKFQVRSMNCKFDRTIGNMMITKQTSACFRGIAILMVVASHYAEWMIEATTYPVVREFLCGFGVLGVDIFFLVSGYGLAKSADAKGVGRNFLWNRLKTCYLPYLLVAGVMMFLEGGFQDGGDVKDYFLGSDYWYISVQMVLYLCFFICYAPETLLSEKWKGVWNKIKDLLLVVLVVGFTYGLYTMGRADFWIVSNGAFLIGVYLTRLENGQRHEKTRQLMRSIPYLLIVCLAVLAFSHFCFNRTLLMRWEMIKSMAFTLSVAGIGLLHDFKCVPLSVLGRYSLYLYLTHGFIYRCVGAWLPGKTHMVILSVWLILTLVVGLLVGLFIEWLMERVPSWGSKHLLRND